MPPAVPPTTADVREYWNRHIHDLDITSHPVGSPGFFADLYEYHFEKLHHLLRLVNFDGYRGRRVLDVGCGAGTDLVRFARGGAKVSGVDLSATAIALARGNFEQQGLEGFRDVTIVPERLPVKSRLHGGWKGAVYNGLFVGTFNLLPRAVVRRFGWHLLAFCRK